MFVSGPMNYRVGLSCELVLFIRWIFFYLYIFIWIYECEEISHPRKPAGMEIELLTDLLISEKKILTHCTISSLFMCNIWNGGVVFAFVWLALSLSLSFVWLWNPWLCSIIYIYLLFNINMWAIQMLDW